MRPWRLWPLAVLVAFTAACSSLPRSEREAGVETLSGRLAVQVEAVGDAPSRSMSAGFELRGRPDRGQLDLSTPLGNVLAQARWSPARVVLATPKGEADYADLDALTRAVLGESLPVAAFFDWLHGRPWEGAPNQPVADGAGFRQLGWDVDLARFGDALVTARREAAPPVTVRIKLDRP